MDLYDECGYDAGLYEHGAWTKIMLDSGTYECKIRALNSRTATRIGAEILMEFGDRDFTKNPLSPEDDLRSEIRHIATALLVDWRGDNWIDPDTREPMEFSPANAIRLLTRAQRMIDHIKIRSRKIQIFQAEAATAAAGNSSRRSGSGRTGNASNSTKRSNGAPASALGR